jgi:hypothetical protein
MRGERGVAPVAQLQEIAFSDTLETAVELHLGTVISHLKAAGCRHFPNLEAAECRPRRVPADIWHQLEIEAERLDVTRIALVRMVLALMGDEYKR